MGHECHHVSNKLEYDHSLYMKMELFLAIINVISSLCHKLYSRPLSRPRFAPVVKPVYFEKANEKF